MKRKIIRQGHNTLTITLPSEWVKKLNLKSGDDVDLIEKNSALVINGNHNEKGKTTEINITNFTIPLLWRFFQSAYRSGCDEIKLIFDSNKREYEDAYHYYTTQFDYSRLGEKVPSKPALAMIQGLVDRFIGMGVLETGKNYCIVREMGESSMKEFDNSLRCIFLIILQMFDRITEAIQRSELNDSSICKEIHTIDLNIDRFVDYCCRILNKIPTSFRDEKKMLLFSTAFILELIGDEFKYIGKHIAFSKESLKNVLPLVEKVKSYFELYYTMFYKFDPELAINIGKTDYLVYNEHAKIKRDFKDQSRSIGRHFMMISKFILVLSELRIEMEY